jgi:hypothetical protein
MRALTIVRDWRRWVATDLLPRLQGHQSNALAAFSYASALAGHCQAGQVAAHVPTPAQRASARRRCERLLANDRLRPALAQTDLARALLAPWAGRTVRLLLAETPKANDLRAWCVRLARAHRALPLATVCYQFGAAPKPLPELVQELLAQVLATLPTDTTVVLLADRGLAWPALVDWCQGHGWHSVLRLQGSTHVRFPDGSERPVRELAAAVGQRWLGEAEVFKKAGWRGADVVATWERGMQEPWLLLTDQEASRRHCRVYGQRRWAEESFRDDQGAGFHWEKSQVDDPAHAARLLLVLALALVLAASQGTVVQERGRRRDLDPHRCRRPSLIQLGLRWLRYAIEHRLDHLLHLDRLYLCPK